MLAQWSHVLGAAGRLATAGTQSRSLPGAACIDIDLLPCTLPSTTRQIPPGTSRLQEVVESGLLARGPWAGSPEDEAAVAEETGARLLCIPLAQPTSLWGGFHTCLYSGYQATEVALFGRPL